MQIYQNMTLDDLKTGMIVTLRNGSKYIVLRNITYELDGNKDILAYTNFDQAKTLGFRDDGCGWMGFNRYKSNLSHVRDKKWDIVRVESPNNYRGMLDLNYSKVANLLWVERPAVKLTVAEIESRLGYKIEIVSDNEEE